MKEHPLEGQGILPNELTDEALAQRVRAAIGERRTHITSSYVKTCLFELLGRAQGRKAVTAADDTQGMKRGVR